MGICLFWKRELGEEGLLEGNLKETNIIYV